MKLMNHSSNVKPVLMMLFLLLFTNSIKAQAMLPSYQGVFSQKIISLSIASNGLVLNLDASKVASYRESGTNWTDISVSGNLFTLPINGSFSNDGGGCFLFNNSSTYSIQNTSVSNLNINAANAISVELWVKHISSSGYQFYLSSPGAVYRFGISNGGFFWDMGRHVDRYSNS